MTNLQNLKFVEINGMRVYNMTLHDITYISTQGKFIFPGNKEACVRVSQDYVSVEHPLGLNTEKKAGEKTVTGLPDYKEGIFYLVSGLVRDQLPERKDLLAPSQNVEHQIKNDKGHTVAVTFIETNL